MSMYIRDFSTSTISEFKKDFADYFFYQNPALWFSRDQRKNIFDLIKQGSCIPADVAAAAITILYEFDYTEKDKLINIASRFCHDLIEDKSFRVIELLELHDLALERRKNSILIVPGCQPPDMWQSRVNAAISFLRDIHVNFKVVFSGLHPSITKRKSLKTMDEAVAMKNYFEYSIKGSQKLSNVSRFVVYTEEFSDTTSSNIAQVMADENIAESEGNNLFVISSLFHLPKLANIIEEYKESKKKTIDLVTLVAAENYLSKNELMYQPAYVKQLFFVFFNFLLKVECEKYNNE